MKKIKDWSNMNNEYCDYLPQRIKTAALNISDGYMSKVRELRFRVNRPLCICLGAESRYLSENGELNVTVKDTTIKTTAMDIKEIFEAACRYSVHSYAKEIANGFITVRGGHRIGLCGTAVVTQNGSKIETVKSISGLNFRIAREVKDCGLELYDKVFSGGLKSLLIAGVPASGKTTFLRDLCRLLGRKYKVCVIDERGELAAVSNGVPYCDIGIQTDVFDGYSKTEGVETAIRVMSPQVIVCDEIGNVGDMEALQKAAVSGVKIIASVHAENIDDVAKKITPSMFDYIALLGDLKLKELIKC